MGVSEPVGERTLRRWAESLAGIAQTGLAFTESQYERERFEEVLKIAGDIKHVAEEGDGPDSHVQEWYHGVLPGRRGYATPKLAVGAAVTNEKGELLLIQRADSGIWLYPTGYCDIGYSALEVCVKEVEEETGITAEPIRLLGILDTLRHGTSRMALYSMLFFCRQTGESSISIHWSVRMQGGSLATICRDQFLELSGGATRCLRPSTVKCTRLSMTTFAIRCGGVGNDAR